MDEQRFTWIPFYEEMAKKLVEYKNQEEALLDIINKIDSQVKLEFPKDKIDPFTFFAMFNKSINDKNRIEILEIIREEMKMKTNTPRDFIGIPTMDNRNSWYGDETKTFEQVERLWQLFTSAVNGNIDEKIFDFCLKIKNVGIASLTQGLFWVSPYEYLPLKMEF